MRRVFTVLAWAYLLLAAAAVLLGCADSFGWFGLKPEALGMVFALLAAMPWTFALLLAPNGNVVLLLLVVVGGIAINAAGLFALARSVR